MTVWKGVRLRLAADQKSRLLGRSKRGGESYVGLYGEPLSEARTTEAAFFNSCRLLLGHAFLESLHPFFSRLFNEGHVLGKMLLGVDLSLFTTFLLIQSELCD